MSAEQADVRMGGIVNRSALVLAVPHPLQGPKFAGHIPDPSYGQFVKGLILDGPDFVFEEASGKSPSIAEGISVRHLGVDHYLDFDPPENERAKYGIAAKTGGGGPIDPCNSPDCYESSIIDEQRKREELWLQRVQQQSFKNALVIVGVLHGLSFSFRLRDAGIAISEALAYIPYAKFCRRPHHA